jgi:hypothetical protein
MTWKFCYITAEHLHEKLSKVRQTLPIKFPKSGSQKQKIFQSKTFRFNEISSHSVSLNTEIFSYEQISQIPTSNCNL